MSDVREMQLVKAADIRTGQTVRASGIWATVTGVSRVTLKGASISINGISAAIPDCDFVTLTVRTDAAGEWSFSAQPGELVGVAVGGTA